MNIDTTKPIYLLGAGGHCKVIVDLLLLKGAKIGGYNALQEATWMKDLKIPKVTDIEISTLCKNRVQLCMAFLGCTTEDLKRRSLAMCEYQNQGAIFPYVIHPNAIVSCNAKLMDGVQILAGTIINASSLIKQGAVINTGSIVEHDAVIGNGVHLAPRSVVLGAAYIGDNSYLGSGSIVIQKQQIKVNSFIKAGFVYKE